MIYLALVITTCLWVLVLWFWRSKPPEVQRSKPVIDTPETRTAAHEAGHALAALRCSLVLDVNEIHTHTEGGYVLYNIMKHRGKEYLWCDAVIRLAGIAAEVMVYGKFRSGPGTKDLLQVRTHVAALVASGRVVPPWPIDFESRSVAFHQMFDEALTPHEVEVMQTAYKRARALLEKDRIRHAQLTGMILACKSLKEPDIERWFGKRRLLKALGVVRGTFI